MSFAIFENIFDHTSQDNLGQRNQHDRLATSDAQERYDLEKGDEEIENVCRLLELDDEVLWQKVEAGVL